VIIRARDFPESTTTAAGNAAQFGHAWEATCENADMRPLDLTELPCF
jgi:hypothetical protein